MKNLIIAVLVTYIFWTDFIVVPTHIAVLPLLLIIFYFSTWAADEWIKDQRRKRKRGSYLVGKIRKMERM